MDDNDKRARLLDSESPQVKGKKYQLNPYSSKSKFIGKDQIEVISENYSEENFNTNQEENRF